jgi:hypothetical protein
MMLHTYGCSWTEGEGADREVEDKITDRDDKRIFRNSLSWPKFLGERLGMVVRNNGISGNANNKIFNQIITDIQDERIQENDFVVVMWSSSLRDHVPFLPKGEWVSWSTKHLMESPDRFIHSYKSEDNKFVEFLSSFKEYFISNLFNQNYYNIVNQNYILFLEKLFSHYNIKYVMCDSFERMIIDINKYDDIRNLVNKKNYWNFDKQTFRDFLNKTNRVDIWEHQDNRYNIRATQHPNKIGYELIANELYEFIIKNKIL